MKSALMFPKGNLFHWMTAVTKDQRDFILAMNDLEKKSKQEILAEKGDLPKKEGGDGNGS